MKGRKIRGTIILMIIAMALVFTVMPLKASAASRTPARVKITKYKVSKVSKKNSTVKINIRWKKVKKATGYEVWEKHGTGDWRLLKKSGRFINGVRISRVLTGKYSIKVRAVRKLKGKKYYGKFSKVKSKFTKSSLSLEQLANEYPEMMKSNYSGLDVSFSGNTVIFSLDITTNPNFANATLEQVKLAENSIYNDLGSAEMLSTAETVRAAVKDNTGVTDVRVRIVVVFKGEYITERDI